MCIRDRTEPCRCFRESLIFKVMVVESLGIPSTTPFCADAFIIDNANSIIGNNIFMNRHIKSE